MVYVPTTYEALMFDGTYGVFVILCDVVVESGLQDSRCVFDDQFTPYMICLIF